MTLDTRQASYRRGKRRRYAPSQAALRTWGTPRPLLQVRRQRMMPTCLCGQPLPRRALVCDQCL